ncbi:MAG: hypothetical protein O2894_09110 [Planctomycetota bacterium]|nr:hypothetical protein [Planctomycetota bacterium]
MHRLACLLVALATLGGCQTDPNAPKATGQVTPTVAGGAAPASYPGYVEARQAFTRQSADGVVIATLEDSAWLRFEGPPEQVEANHRAYFEYGYTAFAVVLRARSFTRPTTEEFLLEDSTGRRVAARPVGFKGNLITVDDRWQYEFDLAFQHTISRDVTWLKLTRISDGEFVEWTFQK